MINTISLEVMGETYHLLYNNEAAISIQELYGQDLSEVLGVDSKESLDATLDVFTRLSEQGELARRHYKYPEGTIPEKKDFEFATPGDVVEMINAIYATVTLGLERKVPSLDDTSLTLMQLEKKRNIPTDGRCS